MDYIGNREFVLGTQIFVTIYIQSVINKQTPITISLDSTLYDLKKVMFEMDGIPMDQQHYIFNGKELVDETLPLGEHFLKQNSVVDFFITLRHDTSLI